jgi:acetyltransferase-like isoleucine patch superfamily enzyme
MILKRIRESIHIRLERLKRRVYQIAEGHSTTIVNTVSGNNLSLGSFSTIYSCNFGQYNRINNGSYLDHVTMGDFSYCGKNATIINCRIGKFCSIAQNVSICLGMHPLAPFVSTHPAFFSPAGQCGTTFSDKHYFEETGHVEIGNDVWIGANVLIMDNVTIGDGAVIAANSVVTKDIPPYAIAGGTPAKVIRFRFEEADIEFLKQFQWWNKDIGWLKANFRLFHDIRYLNNIGS